MAKRKIVWTETAAKQRREILNYWTNRNGSATYTKALIEIAASHLKVIAQSPELFKEGEMFEIRESAMGHFSIFYKFTTDRIIVMAFWDNRQDPKKIIKAIS